MVTLEVWHAMQAIGVPPAIYQFERALQGPYLEIMQRGFLVDQLARRAATEVLRTRIGQLNSILNTLSSAIWDKGLNPRSTQQLREFFYSTMRLPEVWIYQKGVRKLSTNREALEKLDDYMLARPIISCILSIRDCAKQLEVLETEIDPDGRFRASYNIAGTETGRPSSSSNAFGTGGNAQNIAPGLRFVFVSDPGWKLCVIDLEQVEARDVGWFCGTLFGDWSYLDSCERGDLHTNNARLIWPELPWSESPTQNRQLANRNFYREFSYRDMAKRGSHLSNYHGSANMMARSLKIPLAMAQEFQSRYILGDSAAFPCIPRWWQWTAQQLQTSHQLVTPFGRRRHFFGRPGDDTTLREAIAFLPQSTTADRMNLGMWRVWRAMPQIQLLAQTYDSITFQFRESEDANEIIGQALALLKVELTAQNGRKYSVPGEAKLGWNWGYYHEKKNPEGLLKWNSAKPDARTRRVGLQRIMA
jgi:DNA polymerase I-like protein with 3'-5' exonuclease and polymerase domains